MLLLVAMGGRGQWEVATSHRDELKFSFKRRSIRFGLPIIESEVPTCRTGHRVLLCSKLAAQDPRRT